MVTAKRKYELQRHADKKALALTLKTAKMQLANIKKDTARIKRQIAAEKAKRAILNKKRKSR